MKTIKSDDEMGGKSKKEVLIEKLEALEGKTPIDEVASGVRMTSPAVEKAIELLVKRKEVKGKVEDGFYIP